MMVTLALVVAAAYLVRAARVGRAKHTRSDADGGSVLLGKPAMEMGYWLCSPVARLLHQLGVTPNKS